MIRSLKSINPNISIAVLDEPGPGGASHLYSLSVESVPSPGPSVLSTVIRFQKGPLADPNGFTHEALLSIVEDRLKSFQAGSFACRENAVALTKVQEAIMWLNKRTADRVDRGVEGKSVV
jgi:hypothetical protein